MSDRQDNRPEKPRDIFDAQGREATAGMEVDNEKLRQEIAELKRRIEEDELFFRVSLDMFCIAGFDGYFKRLNPAWEKTLGFTTDELLSKPYLEFVHPEDRESTMDAEDDLSSGDIVISFENRYRCKDGSYKWLLWNSIPVRQSQLIYGDARDITHHKQIERRRNAQYATTRVLAESPTLAEATPKILQAVCESLEWDLGAIWTTDRQANVLRCVEVWHVPAVTAPEFEVLTRQTQFKPGIGLPGRVWSSGKPAWISDVVQDPNFPRLPIADKEGLHGAFAFPILFGGEVCGVIEFFSREIREPDQDLLQMLGAIGSQIGSFIERKRGEEEREKLLIELRSLRR
ncbi:MAG TPA: GAF domain-containing protein [Acidobacteriota bacterium]|jgi:PAS domain S-box-containing protein|nr:GAF domain-containing protein [Acidobacteriota bacterium]